MGHDIKLTVRLPEPLHAALRIRAGRRNQSVNREIVDTLSLGLTAGEREPDHERDAVAGMLVTMGLWEPGLSWQEGSRVASEPSASHAALRQSIGAIPPLSDAIIADRGPI